MPERTSLIIPALNEASRISHVIEVGLSSEAIDEVVVVDDGSTDGTADVAREFDVELVEHPDNQGKFEALHTGSLVARELGAKSLLFLDADLQNLSSEHIQLLLEPIQVDEAIMTIGILERTLLQKYILSFWGALSGQRAMSIDTWVEIDREEYRSADAEAAMNTHLRRTGQHKRIQRVELEGLTHVGQREKQPTLWLAADRYARTYSKAARTFVGLPRIDEAA